MPREAGYAVGSSMLRPRYCSSVNVERSEAPTTKRDPAVVDRRQTLLAGVSESSLPPRTMTIAGIEGRIRARILSTDMRGDATRLVQIPPGWGTGLVGSFTAGVEIFVVQGVMTVGRAQVGVLDYVAIPPNRAVSRVRTSSMTLALLMTSGPIRFEVNAGSGPAQIEVARGSKLAWQPEDGRPGRYVRSLGVGPRGPVWIGGAKDWVAGPEHAHSHDHAEEMFVLDGSLSVSEQDGAEVEIFDYEKGGYCFRPGGRAHGGAGSRCDGTSLAFHRRFSESSL